MNDDGLDDDDDDDYDNDDDDLDICVKEQVVSMMMIEPVLMTDDPDVLSLIFDICILLGK